jgi:hypothetical protein
MGLDMYLNAERFLSDYFTEGDDAKAEQIQKLFPELVNAKVSKVIFEVGYWRKANAIHNWFVNNVQEGVDDCGDYHVGREKLQELKVLVEEVIDSYNNKNKNKNAIKSILPPTSGFFFGRTEIDEYYLEDMKRTKKILDNALKMPDNVSFVYHSSW